MNNLPFEFPDAVSFIHMYVLGGNTFSTGTNLYSWLLASGSPSPLTAAGANMAVGMLTAIATAGDSWLLASGLTAKLQQIRINSNSMVTLIPLQWNP